MTDATSSSAPTQPVQTAAAPSQQQTPAAASPADAGATQTPGAQPQQKPADNPADQAQLLFEEPPKEGEGDAAENTETEQKKDGEGEQPAAVDIAELTVPEDMPIPDELKGPLTEYITENKLDKEGAQKLTDLGVKLQQHNLDVWTKTKDEWRKEVETDPVLGGSNLKATVAKANDVIRKFAGSEENLAELKQDLVLLGLGNKRSFVRFLTNIAAATGNDSAGGPSGTGGRQDGFDAMAKRMYPGMS